MSVIVFFFMVCATISLNGCLAYNAVCLNAICLHADCKGGGVCNPAPNTHHVHIMSCAGDIFNYVEHTKCVNTSTYV